MKTMIGSPWKVRSGNRRHTSVALVRCLKLIIELSRRRFGMDLEEVMETLGVVRRQMYRYLHSMEAAGVEFERAREIGPTGKWVRLIRLKSIQGHRLVREALMRAGHA